MCTTDSTNNCLTGFPTLGEVTSNTCPSSCTFEGISSRVQLRLFPTMIITCSGVLQGLTVAGQFGSRTDRPYNVLQIWRPKSASSNEYNRNSTYEFPLSCSTIFTTVQQCNLASPISVEMGDIIGIVLPRNNNNQASYRIHFSTTSPTPNYILDDSAATTFNLPATVDDNNQPLIYLDILEGECLL